MSNLRALYSVHLRVRRTMDEGLAWGYFVLFFNRDVDGSGGRERRLGRQSWMTREMGWRDSGRRSRREHFALVDLVYLLTDTQTTHQCLLSFGLPLKHQRNTASSNPRSGRRSSPPHPPPPSTSFLPADATGQPPSLCKSTAMSLRPPTTSCSSGAPSRAPSFGESG